MAEVSIDNLASEIAKGLEEYTEDLTKEIKTTVEEVSKEAVKELNQDSPKRTGAYARDWKQKNRFENTRSKRNTVYNAKHYQLTHLLEYGHASRNGGRVEAKPHIKKVEQKYSEVFEKKVKRRAEEIGNGDS